MHPARHCHPHVSFEGRQCGRQIDGYIHLPFVHRLDLDG
jgi:hypothetical protein